MARVPMVTRTIKTTKCTVLALNTETAEPFNQTVTLTGVYSDNDKMLKAVKKIMDTDDVKAVKIVDVKEEETLYGMKEIDFIAHAEVLPPRETKTEN